MKKVPKSINDFCDKEELLRLGYIDRKGNAHVVPLWFARVKGDHCIGTGASSPKSIAIRRNPRVGWVIDGGRNRRYKGLALFGQAEEITDGKLKASVYRALSTKYFGKAEHPHFVEIYGEPGDRETLYFRLKPEGGSWWEY